MKKSFYIIVSFLTITGCATGPLKDVGKTPALSPVPEDALSPLAVPAHGPGSYPESPKRYSIWSPHKAGLFTARRAMNIGDIVTVKITLDDEAEFDSQSDRKRNSSKSLGLTGSTSTGLSGGLDGSLNSGTAFDGSGGTKRSESLDVSVAALVSSVLPNGNLYIRGSQEIVVNAEKRVLTVEGIVRPSDILPNSTISYDRIAEARVSYGGAGRITEVQQPPYGQQVLDTLLPI